MSLSMRVELSRVFNTSWIGVSRWFWCKFNDFRRYFFKSESICINLPTLSFLNIVKCDAILKVNIVSTVHSLTLILIVFYVPCLSRKKNRFEIAQKICSHWLMTLKSLDGFCHASKHFFNENCKKGKFPYRLFCCKTMTKTTMQSLLPDSTFDIRVLVKSNC